MQQKVAPLETTVQGRPYAPPDRGSEAALIKKEEFV